MSPPPMQGQGRTTTARLSERIGATLSHCASRVVPVCGGGVIVVRVGIQTLPKPVMAKTKQNEEKEGKKDEF